MYIKSVLRIVQFNYFQFLTRRLFTQYLFNLSKTYNFNILENLKN